MATWAIRPISPVRWQGGKESYRTFALDTGQTFKKGAPVVFDTDTNTIKEASADPSAIVGFATCDAADVAEMYDTFGTVVPAVPVALASENVFRGTFEGTYDADVHVLGTDYGLVLDASGYWTVDETDESNTRVILVGFEEGVADGDVNIPVLFRVLPANAVAVSG